MYKFNELIKAKKLSLNGEKIKIALLGNSSTQFLAQSIEGYSKLENLNVEVFDADYNQVELQLFDKESDVFSFKPQIIIIYLSSEKLLEDFLTLSFNEKKNFADEQVKKILRYWEAVKNNSDAKVVQFNFCEINDKPLGNFSTNISESFIFQVRKINYLLNEAIQNNNNVFPLDLLSIQSSLGYSQLFDPVLFYNSRMTISINSLPLVAKEIVSIIKSMVGKIKKCLIMDLDNTIWGGIIGDDGIDNIEIGELGRGHVFSNLQKWIKQLKECGIILAVCSKNNEEVAKEPFEKHPDMVLKLSDISVFVANWDDKASNIKLIQETLNIGMDSIVFLDDNPFERNLVKQKLKDITVPDLPNDPAHYLDFLIQENLFEVPGFTGNNSDRTAQYQAQFERKKMEMSFESIDDYLKSLEMTCSAKPFEEKQFSRIAQLSQRSNQFNLRTIRYTDNDVEKISKDSNYITLTCSLRDKFGDYGLVSVIIVKKMDNDTGFIENWLMSCRALKRGLEEFTINKIISVCRMAGLKVLCAEYLPTEKNIMVKDIYEHFGFSKLENNKYNIQLSDYKEKKNFIREV